MASIRKRQRDTLLYGERSKGRAAAHRHYHSAHGCGNDCGVGARSHANSGQVTESPAVPQDALVISQCRADDAVKISRASWRHSVALMKTNTFFDDIEGND